MSNIFHCSILIMTAQVFLLFFLSECEAEELANVLERGFSFNIAGGSTAPLAKQGAPVLSNAISQAITNSVSLPSVGPAFVYRLNPKVKLYEQFTNIPGPLFSERPLSVGKGRFNMSLGYAFINFSDLNSTATSKIKSPGLLREVFISEGSSIGRLSSGEELFSSPASLSQLRTKIDLKAHIILPTFKYGISDNWEASISIPIIYTSLKVKNEIRRMVDTSSSARFSFARDAQGNVVKEFGYFDPFLNSLELSRVPFVESQRPVGIRKRTSGSSVGIGDIILRTKYHFWQKGLGGAGFGLNLQLPSGAAEDFRGTDETHLSTFLFLSQVYWEIFEPRLNIGIDINADDVNRSSFLYTLGGTTLVGESLGVSVDFIGRSEFGKLSFPKALSFNEYSMKKNPSDCTSSRPCFIDKRITTSFFPKIKRNDTIDFSFGLRYVLGRAGSLFFGFVIPLNYDGFRSDFIPSGGLEYTF